MKIQLTMSIEQLQIVAESLVFSSINDRLLRKTAAWKDLHAIVRMANDEVNNDVPRQATYKLIK
jgi:hypothetical protein